MQYKLTSIERHADKGFGVTAEAFKEAADHLNDNNFTDNIAIVQGEMPILYLYRHSIELFLKSLILHIHKELNIPFLDNPKSGNHPFRFNDKGRQIDLENCHSLQLLFEYLCELIKNHQKSLSEKAPRATWLITGRIRGYVRLISSTDDKSDYFRYPISRDHSKDKHKHSVQQVKFKNMKQEITNGKKKMMLALRDDEGAIKELHVKNDHILEDLFEAIKGTADFFESFHFMTRFELCKGW